MDVGINAQSNAKQINAVFAISLSRWSKAINAKICENFSKNREKSV